MHSAFAKISARTISFSSRNTLRGLHDQIPHAQANLVQVLQGEIFDVAVDIRLSSPSFGRAVGVTLSERNWRQVFIPKGFAHGFCVLSETALFLQVQRFLCARLRPGRAVVPAIDIQWPVKEPLLSAKDQRLPLLKDIPPEGMPIF